MAGDANLRANLELKENAADAAARIRKVMESDIPDSAKKGQAQLAAIFGKGEPTKALEAQLAEQLRKVVKLQKDGKIALEEAERSKTELTDRYLKARGELERKALAESTKATVAATTTAGTAVTTLQGRLKGMNEPIEGLRLGLSRLGGGAGTLVGDIGGLTQGLTSLGGKAGVAGAILAATGLIASKMVEEFKKAQAVEAQFQALNQTFGVTRAEVNQVRTAFSAYNDELDKKTVQTLIATGKEAGLSVAEMSKLGAEIKRVADLTGSDFLTAAKTAFSEFRKEARQSSEELSKLISGMKGQLQGNTALDVAGEKAVTDAEKSRGDLQKRIANLQAKESRGVAGFSGSMRDRQEALDAARAELGNLQGQLVQAEQRVTEEVNKRNEARKLEADLIRQNLDDAALGKLGAGGQPKSSGGGGGGGGRGGSRSSRTARPMVFDPVAVEFDSRVGLGPQSESPDADMMGEIMRDSENAAALARNQAKFEPLKQQVAAFDSQMEDFTDNATAGAIEGLATAGLQGGNAFIDNIDAVINGKSGKDVAKGFLGILTQVLSFLPGGGIVSGLVSLATGQLRGGGGMPPRQARGGIGLLPGVNFDAEPVFMHPGEVTPKREVVGQFPGGYAAAEQWARGKRPLPGGGGGGGPVTVVLPSFSPSDSAAAVEEVVTPGLRKRLDNHLSQSLARSISDATQPMEWR